MTFSEPPDFPYNCHVSNQSDNVMIVLCTYSAQLNHSESKTFLSNNYPVNYDLEDENNMNLLDAFQVLPKLSIYPITFYFAEVYNKNDFTLVSNLSTFLNLSSIFASSSSLSSSFYLNTPESEYLSSNSLRNFQFFITDLQPSTTFRIKLYASNTRGRSDDIWLEGSTLRSAEKLVDHMADSSHDRQDDTPYNDSIASNTQLRGPKLLLIIFIIGASIIFLIIFLGILAIFRLRQNLMRHNNSGSSSNNRDRSSSREEVMATLSHKGNTSATRGDTDDACNVYHPGEDDDECCCDNDMSQEILLTSNSSQQQHANHCNKGPPDIIPALGYCVVTSTDKQYLYGQLLFLTLNLCLQMRKLFFYFFPRRAR